MIMQFINDHIVGFIDGGISISYGSLCIIVLWIATAQSKRIIRQRIKR